MSESGATLLAALDIGSSAIRMDIAQVHSDGTIRLLDSLKKGVQLGKDAFTEGSFSEETIRAACSTLRDFKKVMNNYGVVRYRAVATSAVRESSNSDTFLDRVLMSTGLDVEVIDGPEENRLTYAAVLESVKEIADLQRGPSLLVEVGGGSTDVTLLRGSEPLQSGTFAIGSIRIQRELDASSRTADQRVRMLRRQVAGFLSNVKRAIPLREAVNYVAVGGDVRVAGKILGGGTGRGPFMIPMRAFADLVESILPLSQDELARKYALSYLDAETLAPALLANLLLLRDTKAEQIIISDASIRLGILQDLAPHEDGERQRQLTGQILSAARSLGRKYQFDENHAERVRELAELIFDEVRAEHGLNPTHRLYLQVAALLHDIGLFIGPSSHHKHSQYLIESSGLFGLRKRELEIIGNVARYHRRALPQRSHGAYVSLDRDERVIVSKLSAILRVANALDKGQLQRAADTTIMREGDQLVIVAKNVPDLTIERISIASRSDLFHEVFGKKILLREAARMP